MNNTWEIEVTSPLLRPGMTIRTTVSERYLVPALKKAMDAVREFNTEQTQAKKAEAGEPSPTVETHDRGLWRRDADYIVKDRVFYEGVLYQACCSNRSVVPSESPSCWKSIGIQGKVGS